VEAVARFAVRGRRLALLVAAEHRRAAAAAVGIAAAGVGSIRVGRRPAEIAAAIAAEAGIVVADHIGPFRAELRDVSA
jgi:hypothetical protein